MACACSAAMETTEIGETAGSPVSHAARMIYNLNSNGNDSSAKKWVELSRILLDALWMFNPFVQAPCLHVARAAHGCS